LNGYIHRTTLSSWQTSSKTIEFIQKNLIRTLLKIVLHQPTTSSGQNHLYEIKKILILAPADGLEQKRVSVYSPLSVWTKKECRLSSRSWFGMKKYTF